MSSQTVIFEKVGQLGVVTLNRPEASNRINMALAGALADVCAEINQDQEIRAVIITGAGESFSAGTDRGDRSSETILWSVATPVDSLGCPVIAAINGDALGQGLEMALACDLRLAAETTRLGLPDIASGFIPRDGGTQRLPRLIGRARALELILTGESISAAEARQLGLVNKVVPPPELMSTANTIAQRIASSAPLALRYSKEAVNKGSELTLGQGLRLESDLYAILQTTVDRTEGITSFLEKRRPEFKGK
ncbi:enoyl-CoA hydratase/isomerase family protein [Chloroflexota bacterium]